MLLTLRVLGLSTLGSRGVLGRLILEHFDRLLLDLQDADVVLRLGGDGTGCAPDKAEGSQSPGGDAAILALIIGELLEVGGLGSRRRSEEAKKGAN